MGDDAHTSGEKVEALRARLAVALADRYDVGDALGSGAAGIVFTARDRRYDRDVAIKVLRPAAAARVGSERFLREVRLAAGLGHPHIVTVFDSGVADGLLYYVMPRVRGRSLAEVIREEGALPVARARTIALEIAEGLAHAHEAGIVHRDVKPANILLVDRHALLTDFGVAIAPERDDGLTTTGIAVGTPAYMSPEQIVGDEEVDARSDIFSLGCVLLEMLLGERPPGSRPAWAVLGGETIGSTLLRERRRDVPPALIETVDRALAPKPADRFPDAAAFADALAESPTVRGRSRRGWMAAAAVAVVAVAATAWFGRPAPDLSDRAGSVVVLPYGGPTSSADEQQLAVDLADELTRQLNRWDSVRAVPQLSLAGVTFDLGLEGPVLRSVADGVATARELDVELMVALGVVLRGDSAVVTATRFDPRRGRTVGRPIESTGSPDDPYRLAAPIAHALLALDGPVETVEMLRRQSSNAAALRRYASGLDHLERWGLARAEADFRAAVAMDSTFAMAQHYLGVTLYWDGYIRSELAARGVEAAQSSRAAVRHGEDLPPRERGHVQAFNRFLEGDYVRARAGYRDLLARDSTDVYALLLQGMVEYTDPWLEPSDDGSWRVRRNWNVAARSFREAARLSPGFYLGYGQLFDMADEVIRGVEKGFRLPADEYRPPWEPTTDPTGMIPFGVAALDSLVWIPSERFSDVPVERREAGARALLDSSLRTLRRWAAFAPGDERPWSELTSWTLRQRSLLPTPHAPQRIDSLSRVALDHLRQALAVTPDTLPSQLGLLANLYLADGDVASALSWADEAVRGAEARDEPPPLSAANPFLHAGDWRRAESVARAAPAPSAMRYPDRETGAMLGDGGVGADVRRIALLSAADVPRDSLASGLRRIDRLWTEREGSIAPLPVLLGRHVGRLAAALASDPEVLERWRSDGALRDPVWAVLAGPDAGGDEIEAVIAVDRPEVREPMRTFVLAQAAIDAGEPALALRLVVRMDSLILDLDDLEVGWGLRTLGLELEARAWAASGDTARATSALERYVDRVGGADPEGPRMREAAAWTRGERDP